MIEIPGNSFGVGFPSFVDSEMSNKTAMFGFTAVRVLPGDVDKIGTFI